MIMLKSSGRAWVDRRVPPRFALTVTTTLLLAITGSARGIGADLTPDERDLAVASFDHTWATIRDKHWDPDLGGLDWEGLRTELRPRVQAAKSKAEVRGILKDLISRLRQSHCEIMPAESIASGNLGGGRSKDSDTGLGFTVRCEDVGTVVSSVVPNSPAQRAGVSTGWILRAIGGTSPSPFALNGGHFELLSMLLSAPAPGLGLTFATPDNKEVTVELSSEGPRTRTHQFGSLPPFQPAVESKVLSNNVGYLRFNWFFDPFMVMSQIHRSMQACLELDGLILDVRGNGGGMVQMGSSLAAWLLDEEGLYFGTTRFRDGEQRHEIHPRPETFEGPVAILIDRGCGSATEIFSGGMKDLGRARLFGSQTMGSVLPAAFEPLPNGDVLMYPIADYTSVGGGRLEGVGVSPHQEVLSTDVPNTNPPDVVLQTALDWMDDQLSSGRVMTLTKPPKGEEIVERFIEATGGRDAHLRIQNRRIRGTRSLPRIGVQGPFTQWKCHSSRSASRYATEDLGILFDGNDGEIAWSYSVLSGPRVFGGLARHRFLREASLRADVSWRNYFDSAAYAGEHPVGDRLCQKVVRSPKHGEKETHYYDRESGLLLLKKTVLDAGAGMMATSMYYEDYRKVDGLLLPHRIRAIQPGFQEQVDEIHQIEHDIDLDEAVFVFPKQVLELIESSG